MNLKNIFLQVVNDVADAFPAAEIEYPPSETMVDCKFGGVTISVSMDEKEVAKTRGKHGLKLYLHFGDDCTSGDRGECEVHALTPDWDALQVWFAEVRGVIQKELIQPLADAVKVPARPTTPRLSSYKDLISPGNVTLILGQVNSGKSRLLKDIVETLKPCGTVLIITEDKPTAWDRPGTKVFKSFTDAGERNPRETLEQYLASTVKRVEAFVIDDPVVSMRAIHDARGLQSLAMEKNLPILMTVQMGLEESVEDWQSKNRDAILNAGAILHVEGPEKPILVIKHKNGILGLFRAPAVPSL